MQKKAFTLIELLVVIAIISLLVSILLPSLERAKELAKRSVCASNLHSVAVASNIYASENRDFFPSGWSASCEGTWETMMAYRDNKDLLLGKLVDYELLPLKAMFCPSQESEWYRLGSAINPVYPDNIKLYLRTSYNFNPHNSTITPTLKQSDLPASGVLAMDIVTTHPDHFSHDNGEVISVLYGGGNVNFCKGEDAKDIVQLGPPASLPGSAGWIVMDEILDILEN